MQCYQEGSFIEIYQQLCCNWLRWLYYEGTSDGFVIANLFFLPVKLFYNNIHVKWIEKKVNKLIEFFVCMKN